MADGTIIVTGANGSLALQFAQQMIKKHPSFTLVLTVRNASLSDPNTAQLNSIIEKSPSVKALVWPLDLGSLEAVRKFTDEVKAKVQKCEIPKVRAIICNAFTWSLSGPIPYSEDGYELGFQGRIIFLGSVYHATPGVALPDDINQLVKPEDDLVLGPLKSGIKRYSIAKLANVMFMHELNSRMEKEPSLSSIRALAMDPGNLPQSRAFKNAPFALRILMNYVLANMVKVARYFTKTSRPTADAAADLVEMAVGNTGQGKSGYFVGTSPSKSSATSLDSESRQKLWKACVEWSGLAAEDTELRACS